MRRASPAPLCGVLLLAGCGGRQSTLRTDSAPAGKIAHLWWIMFIGSAIVCAVVFMLVLAAVLRARGRREPAQEDGRGAKGMMLFGGALVPLVVLVALFVLILRTLPSTAQPKPRNSWLHVEVVGHQWFWEVRYPGGVVTANELHIPAGDAVDVKVQTDDVVHSFWVPGLNRKIDMIPGRENHVLLQAREPGIYRGQCAEFCGLQHAKMSFLVYVDPPLRFRNWLENQSRPAASTTGKGHDVFMRYGCSGCHTLRGTQAQGKLGPDLTHLASRSTLAAATIPNRRGYLGGWILDPQHIKPGNKMPGINVSGPELQQLLDYLGSLK